MSPAREKKKRLWFSSVNHNGSYGTLVVVTRSRKSNETAKITDESVSDWIRYFEGGFNEHCRPPKIRLKLIKFQAKRQYEEPIFLGHSVRRFDCAFVRFAFIRTRISKFKKTKREPYEAKSCLINENNTDATYWNRDGTYTSGLGRRNVLSCLV